MPAGAQPSAASASQWATPANYVNPWGPPTSAAPATTYVSNITLPGGGTRQVRFADAASQSAAEQLLRELAQAKGAAS